MLTIYNLSSPQLKELLSCKLLALNSIASLVGLCMTKIYDRTFYTSFLRNGMPFRLRQFQSIYLGKERSK